MIIIARASRKCGHALSVSQAESVPRSVSQSACVIIYIMMIERYPSACSVPYNRNLQSHDRNG